MNDAPTITDLADTSTPEDTATSALAFTIGDVETAAASLTVTATSSDTTLIPNANLVIGGTGATRTLTATPAANQLGTSTITVTVNDGTTTTSDTFVLTVTAVNDAPVRTSQQPIAILIDHDSHNVTAVPLGLNALTYSPGGGTDESTQNLTCKVTYIPSFIQLFRVNGTTPVVINGDLDLSDLKNITYKTLAGQSGTGEIKWEVSDNGNVNLPNLNLLTESLVVTVLADEVGPIAPSMPVLDLSSDTGIKSDSKTTETSPKLTVVGPSDAASMTIVLVSSSSIPVSLSATRYLETDMWWATASSLSVAAWAVTAKAKDLAGNESTRSQALTLTIAAAPMPPDVPDLLAADDSGVSDGDNVTNVRKPMFTVTAPLRTTKVELFVDNKSVGYATIGPDGTTWSKGIDAPMLDGVLFVVRAVLTDDIGNVSNPSSPLNLTIDTTGPVLQSFSSVLPSPRKDPVNSITSTFNENVFGMTPNTFGLAFNNYPLRFLNAPTTEPVSPITSFGNQKGATNWLIKDLQSLTTATGTYTLSLTSIAAGLAVVTDQAGNAIGKSTEITQWVTDVSQPTATLLLLPVAATPRKDPVNAITVTFSKNVTGVDAADFVLTRTVAGVPTQLTGFAVTGSGSQRTVTGLALLSAVPGSYELRLKAEGSGITDVLGNAFALDAATQWEMDATPPTGNFDSVTTPLGSALQSIALTFNEPVKGVELGDFTLTRNNVSVSLAKVTLSPSNGTSKVYVLSSLGSLNSTTGAYELTFSKSTGTPTTDIAGNPLASSISRNWSVDTDVPTATISLPSICKTSVLLAEAVFSLPVTGVTKEDFRLTRDGDDVSLINSTVSGSEKNWTLGILAGLTASSGHYVLTLVAAGSSIVRAVLPANPLTANAVASWTMDTSPPEVTLAVVGRAISVGATKFTVQAMFSEKVNSFTSDKITVSPGGAKSTVTPVGTDGRVYQFDVTVSPAQWNPVTVKFDGDKTQDAAGNNNTASKELRLITDFIGPTVTLTSDDVSTSTPTKLSAFTVKATFSEQPVTGVGKTALTNTALTVTNGTVTNMQGSGANYTFTVTPIKDGLVGVRIGANKAFDASDNGNSPSNNFVVRVDRVVPTVKLSSLSGALSRESFLRFAATFSEPVTGVAKTALTVANGTVTAVQGSGASYTFLVEPKGDGEVTVALPADKASDAAGNKNTASTPLDVKVVSDRTAPTASVSKPISGVCTISFNEAITGFDKSDLRLTRNGAVLPLTLAVMKPVVDGTLWSWSLDLTQLIATQGNYVLSLKTIGSGILDLAGNPLVDPKNTIATFSTDTTPPVAAISGNGQVSRLAIDKAMVSFSEPVTGVDIADFELRRDGVVVPLIGSSVSPSQGPATAYVIQGLPSSEVEGAYSLRLRALGSSIIDTSGNPLANDAVGNWVFDSTPPKATIRGVNPVSRTTSVSTLPIAFSEPVTGLDISDFTLQKDQVTVMMSGATVSRVGTSGSEYILSGLGSLTGIAGSYKIKLRAANTGITDRAGNAMTQAAFAEWANTAAPTLGSVSASFVPVTPNPRLTPVDSTIVSFSAPVFGVDAADFVLTRTVAGVPTQLTGFAVTGSGSQRTVTGLAPLSAVPGSYELRLKAKDSTIATAVGVVLTIDAVATWNTVAIPANSPTARIEANQSAVPGTVVDAVKITFTKPVTGLTLAALRFTRDGVPISLNGTVLTGSGRDYSLRGLAPISSLAATYALTLVAAGSGIRDSLGIALAANAIDQWTVNATTLRAAFLGVDGVRTTPVPSIQLRFSSLVKGVDIGDFKLTCDGRPIPLYGASVTGSGASWVIGNLAALQSKKGIYIMELTGVNGDIKTGAGMTLTENATITWTIS